MQRLLVIAVGLLLASCGGAAHPPRAIPGATAEELPALSYRLRGGGTWSSADFRGKVVVIDVWATYCKPCKKAFPKLDAIHALGDDVAVIGVSVDEEDAVVDQFLTTTPAAFAIGRDPEQTVQLPPLRLTQLPTVLVLDRQGRLRYRGEQLEEADYDGLRVLVERLRAEPRSDTPSRPSTSSRLPTRGRA
ncbi:MAG: TlpA disulfide reductase family protein [Kofleriaceae bacterium]|nr:TlpA disulfide reductase family protein [Kofleriaceae bacterium]